MKKLIVTLLMVLALAIVGVAKADGTDPNYPLTCDGHPTEPWLCDDGADAYYNWNYTWGFNFGYDPVASNDPTFLNNGSRDDGVTSSTHLDENFTPGTTSNIDCNTSRGTKRVLYAGAYEMRGTGRVNCTAPATITQSVCLIRRANFGSDSGPWNVQACRAGTRTGISYTLGMGRICVYTGLLYNWKVRQAVYITAPYHLPATGMFSSFSTQYACE